MKRTLPTVVGILMLLSFSTTTLLSQVSLVQDINTNPSEFNGINNYSALFCNCGEYLFFPASTEIGRELWRTDGTAEGTFLMKDIYKGFGNGASSFQFFCNGSGIVYFTGNDGSTGAELWISNGTTSGTKLVKDITPGASGFMEILGLLGNTVYFLTDHDLDNQMEIWKSDGSAGGTTLVSVLNFPGYSNSYTSIPSASYLLFNLFNNSQNRFELWKLDGPSGVTEKVLENVYITGAVDFGDQILFATSDQSDFTYSMWASDGTPTGTIEIKDFGSTYMQSLHKFNDKLIFVNGLNTWISDGTEVGTTILTTGNLDASAIIDNDFYGIGYDHATSSNRLLKIDGTTLATTVMNGNLGDITGSGTIPVLNNKLLWQIHNASVGKELGLGDENHQGFTLIKDINPGSGDAAPRAWATFKDRVYFLADNGTHGSQIWSTDGTAQGTSLLKLVMTGTANANLPFGPNMAIIDNKLHLIATSGNLQSTGRDMFTIDGSATGVTLKHHFANGAPLIGRTDKDLIYMGYGEFYRTNGLTEDVTLFKDISADLRGFGINPGLYFTLGAKSIFPFSSYDGNYKVGLEYWVTDGTESGTQLLKDIFPGNTDGISTKGIVVDSKLIFDAKDPVHGSELWISDGTPDGTVLLKDISEGVTDSNPAYFSVLNNKVIFSATTSGAGNEVWITDGTEQGTSLLIDIIAGAVGSSPRDFKSIGNAVIFSAYDEVNGWTLWKTDGTSAGTIMIKDIIPGNDKFKYPTSLTAVNGKLYFAANDNVHGLELWISDGTTSGTYLIDVVQGSQSSDPSMFTAVKGVIYFKANAELWRTNGTAMGTAKISDLEPLEMLSQDNLLYFLAPHPEYGIELFKAEFKKVDQQITFNPITDKTFGNAPFQVVATASSGLPVVITSEEELTIVDQTATIVKPGTVRVTVAQCGDDLFNPAQVCQTFCILPAKPSINVTGMGEGEPVLTSNANAGNQWFAEETAIASATSNTFSPSEDNTYKLNVTIDGCTSEFSDDAIIIIMGTESRQDFISFYPNPVKQSLRIETASDAGTLSIAIMDVHGKMMSANNLSGNETIDYSFENYPPGFYFVRIVTEKGTSYKKIIKE